jgi:cardiolipin synthase
MSDDDPSPAQTWPAVPRPRFVGGNAVRLLQGGDELFPAMRQAIERAEREVWLATYIFDDDVAGSAIAAALVAAARRGVQVQVVVDGFGSLASLSALRRRLEGSAVQLVVFRPLQAWYAWLQPGQLRRLHQKLCAVDQAVAFVGGVNLIDDRHDQRHGWGDSPRLDFAVEISGALALQVQRAARAMWWRAHLGQGWRDEVRTLVRSAAPVEGGLALLSRLRSGASAPAERLPGDDDPSPVRAALVVRDNFRQRRAIERSYVEAIRRAQRRIDIACPYFYPGRSFRRALRLAAARGVKVRLLMQGKIDYRFAAMAARVLYVEMLHHGIRIFEYTPAFLHAKVAVVDDDWATVGSSNIDPLSLLLNLEANVVVRDPGFAQALARRLDASFAASKEVVASTAAGWRGWLSRGFIAWCASVYLRIAGITGRY